MDRSKILVVDDEKDMADMIVMRLTSAGFDASAAYSGKDAIRDAKKNKPDLVVLDLLMPEMDGYQVSSVLKDDKSTANIPIIMLTAKDTSEDRVKALKMGIDDYVTKPYHAGELAARVEAVLRRTKTRPRVSEKKPLSLEDKKRMEFLEYLNEQKIAKLEPTYNMVSKNGYEYKKAAEFFKTKDGSELEHLKHLAENQVFTKEFFDKVLLCPYCFHHDVNIHETNPETHSSNIKVEDTVHHFQCGYVGIEEEFMVGVKYICPKCHKELKHIGVDYDKPGKIYIDRATGEKFTEPDVYCQCRNCQLFFEAGDAVRRDIYSFLVAGRAKEVRESGQFEAMNMEQALVDQDINVYNSRYFSGKFSEEIERAQKFKRPLSLVLVSITNFDEALHSKGDAAAKSMLRGLVGLFKENLWSIDIPARYRKNSFINLLPEAGKEQVREMIDALKRKIQPFIKDGLEIKIQTISFPDDASSEEKLLEKLVKSRSV